MASARKAKETTLCAASWKTYSNQPKNVLALYPKDGVNIKREVFNFQTQVISLREDSISKDVLIQHTTGTVTKLKVTTCATGISNHRWMWTYLYRKHHAMTNCRSVDLADGNADNRNTTGKPFFVNIQQTSSRPNRSINDATLQTPKVYLYCTIEPIPRYLYYGSGEMVSV